MASISSSTRAETLDPYAYTQQRKARRSSFFSTRKYPRIIPAPTRSAEAFSSHAQVFVSGIQK